MTPKRYRKRPVEIKALQLTADNAKDVCDWISGASKGDTPVTYGLVVGQGLVCVDIETLEGTMRAVEGDWIIRGVAGEFYPCKPEIFAATYEPVDPESRPPGVTEVIDLARRTAAADALDVSGRL